MIKNLLAVVTIALLFVSCGNNAPEEKTILTVEQTLEQIQDLVDSTITIEGTVVHVCRHGGGKMFLVGENPESKIKIVAGDVVTMFERELEGSDVIVEGKIIELRIDEAYLIQWEQELTEEIAADTLAEVADEAVEGETEVSDETVEGKTGVADEAVEAVEVETEVEEKEGDCGFDAEPHADSRYDDINNLRKELEESGKEYLSFYSIECTKVTVKKVEDNDDDDEDEDDDHEGHDHEEGEENDHNH